ncbi:MAG: extracellular solute-binding protein [Microbacteriaceae bacterium]|nr:extracellular solute-binding protein [Microbacteriaceae bacterium]
MTHAAFRNPALTRRGFLGFAGGTAAALALSACTGSGPGGSANAIKFWDMPWGTTSYTAAAQKLTQAYKPTGSDLKATYQEIQWNNFTQTFASAVASKTGPAVSTGGGFQAFQYAQQGAIAYADDLLDTFKKNGIYDDFLPGVVEPFKMKDGYAAVPTQLDMRVWWYRKSILDEVGVELPTTWDEYLAAGKKLAAKGYYAFGTGAGAGNNIGAHSMIVMMINNGGGLFNAAGELDCVTDRNIEAMDFVKELVAAKIVDPGALAYTTDNLTSQWKSKKIAMGISTAGLNNDLGDTTGDVLVAQPMAGPHGDKGTLQFLNNIMMYTNTPSQASSEAFLTYWFQNYKTLWQQKVIPALPVLKSITELPEFQQSVQQAEVVKTWQPIGKTYAAQGTQLTPLLAAIDAGQALSDFTQTMLAGKTDSKTALASLETAIKALKS